MTIAIFLVLLDDNGFEVDTQGVVQSTAKVLSEREETCGQ